MTDTIIPSDVPAPVAAAILHFIKAASDFATHTRATTENKGQDIAVPSDAMTGFFMMVDFLHSRPKGIVVNEQAMAMGMKPIIFDIHMIGLMVEFIASEAVNNPCDCPVCTAHKEAQAVSEAAAVAVKH